MRDKVCIVTGATGGLGKAIARGLAQLDARVVLACRDKERGERVQWEIVSATGNRALELIFVDLANRTSIRTAAAQFKATHDRLDVLINTAAVFQSKRTTTPDGFETMFVTNHLGPFLLTNLLLDKLRASAPARIINVTAPSTVPLDFDDLQSERKFRALHAFGASKMANLLFTYELARRLDGTGVTVNAVHPGLVKSDLMRESPRVMNWVVQWMSAAPEKGAETPVYLATSPDVAKVTGKFFKDKKSIESNAYSHDAAVQNRLWEVSAALTHR